jgi:hypothetical protein
MAANKRSAYKKLDAALAPTMSTIEYLTASLVQLEQAAQDAIDSRSWQACSALKLRALQTRVDLDAAIEKANRPDDTMSDEQLLGIIVQAIAQLPAPHLERLEEAIAMRRGGAPLRLVTGTDG